ncbi:ABC transporter ATP-binding protein [Clostridium sp.]|uniref:ABC transporter ATP-binding protein n=1 Tax=Clostridium sp. TaxID=1506 RepID=UPI003217188E
MKDKNKEGKSRRSLMTNIKFLVKNAWAWDKGVFINFVLFTIVTAIAPFIAIFTPKFLIDELTGANRLENILIILIGFFIISAIVNYLSAYLQGASLTKMIKIRFGFITTMYDKCMSMDFRYTEDPEILNNLETAGRAVSNNNEGIEGIFHKLFQLFGAAIGFLGYMAIVSTLSPWVLIYLIVNVSIVYYFTTKVKTYEYSKKDKISELNRKSNYIYDLMYNFAYGKDIRIFNLSNWIADKFVVFKDETVGIRKDIKNEYFKVSLVDVFLLLIREGIVYGYLIYMVLKGGMSIGNFTMYFATISGFAAWMQGILENIAHINAQNLYVNDFRDFIEFQGENGDTISKKIPKDITYEIEFKNVSFKYPKSEKYVYKNLNLEIKKGERLAIVGVNGAGKTTFVKLLTRLYEPTEGEILINGVNINSFDKKEYYKLFSPVFQEIKMFAFPIAENVALVNQDYIDRERVVSSIEKAGMLEKINSLEKGIETSLLKVLDSTGIELSGGENQRLALARALYKDAPIVVLDEPTAALDPIAEYNIYKSFDSMIGEKTAIYISHRLASTRFCDVIAFFEDGEIQEYGTHEELLNRDGKYAAMFNVQASYYKEEELEVEGA